MPNAELSSRSCDQCGRPAEVPKQEAPRWREQGPPANAALPRQNPSLGAFKAAKLEDFFDRTDLDCGLAPLGEKKKPNGTGDRYQAGFMGHGSVWELGPAAEKVARKCLRLLDTFLVPVAAAVLRSPVVGNRGSIAPFLRLGDARKVLPVLEDDVLAKFLHGSAHYFLRKAMSATETEQRTASRTAKAKLMEDYRENACEFLSALFHEAGEADKAQDVLKGLSVDVDQVSTSVNGINGHANGGADAKAQPKATSAGDSRWAWRQRREPKSVEAPEEVPVAKPSPKQEVISAKLKEAPSKSSGIPSIDEVLARLDLEEQQEQETHQALEAELLKVQAERDILAKQVKDQELYTAARQEDLKADAERLRDENLARADEWKAIVSELADLRSSRAALDTKCAELIDKAADASEECQKQRGLAESFRSESETLKGELQQLQKAAGDAQRHLVDCGVRQ
eukprot:g13497.t1